MAERGRGSSDATRRRFARRQWARRWLRWRWLAAAAAVLVVAVTMVWVVWFSSVLSVEKVTVSGTGYLSADEIRAAAAVPPDQPLARLDLEAIQRRVQALAPVRRAEVSRVWPDGLRIKVQERQAIAVVSIGGVVRGLDADGVLFRTYPSKPRDLPLVQAEPDTRTEAIAESAAVVSAMPPELARTVDHVEARTLDQITLVLRDGRSVRWGSSEDSELKARVLEDLLTRRGRTFDVSVPGNPLAEG